MEPVADQPRVPCRLKAPAQNTSDTAHRKTARGNGDPQMVTLCAPGLWLAEQPAMMLAASGANTIVR